MQIEEPFSIIAIENIFDSTQAPAHPAVQRLHMKRGSSLAYLCFLSLHSRIAVHVSSGPFTTLIRPGVPARLLCSLALLEPRNPHTTL